MNRQQELESHAMAEGRARYLRRIQEAKLKGQMATVGAGKSLVMDAIQPLTTAMEQTLSVKKRGMRHIAEIIVPLVGVDVVAYMTIRTVLNEILKRQVVGVVAFELADLMLDELRYRRFKEQAPALWDYKLKTFKTSSYQHKSRSLDFTLRTAQTVDVDGVKGPIAVDDLDLSDAQRMALGMWAINQLVLATELVYVKTQTEWRRGHPVTIKLLVAPPETLQWLEDRDEAMELLWPVSQPMVEPPLPWSPGVRGGYRFALKRKFPLVRGVSRAHQQSLATTPMQPVYDALNTIQNTAWCINTQVADVAQELLNRGGGCAGMQDVGQQELPPRPREVDEFEQQRKVMKLHVKQTGVLPSVSPELRKYLDEWKVWRKKAQIVKTENHERKFMRLSLVRLMDMVDRFRDDAAMYFVYNVDFRGRVYPVVSTLLSPQGDDLSKGLLTFAKARPLGREGRRYLAQHGASCLDEHNGVKFSKLSIEERVQYIETHSAWIEQMAGDPLAHRDWMKADSPFCFLAFCFEWARMKSMEAKGVPSEEFYSSLPCAQDGSCNGIQHFSAMLRDPVGGAAVNLIPSPLPQDIYLKVMHAVEARLVADASNPALQHTTTIERTARKVKGQTEKKTVNITSLGRGTLATMWLTSGLITRKLVKRPVMTYPYGSRAFGFSTQILQYLQHTGDDPQDSQQKWKEIRKHFTATQPGDVLKDGAQYLATVIMDALETTVVAAAEAMDWLKRSARQVAGNGVCVKWTVPATGFKVSQEYMVMTERRVDTLLLGSMYKPIVNVATETPHAIKQGNAVAPNVVHSLDAAALMMTVREAARDGVESFAMIHDSYGAPAGDCAVLAKATRNAFVKLYSETDVVEVLHAELMAQLPESDQRPLPAVPQKGTLDLSGVHAADFFFA